MFERATLTHDDSRNRYRLEGNEPAYGQGQVVAFEGKLDASGKLLTLERNGQVRARSASRSGQQQLRSLHDAARTTKSRAPSCSSPGIEVGLTKEGESFAAGSTVADPPSVHRDRRRRHDDGLLPGPDLPDLLHRLPRRVQREPREVPQEAEPQGSGHVGDRQDRPAEARRGSAGSRTRSRAMCLNRGEAGREAARRSRRPRRRASAATDAATEKAPNEKRRPRYRRSSTATRAATWLSMAQEPGEERQDRGGPRSTTGRS